MTKYTLTEPHPTVPEHSYTHSGRGGAGNYFRAPLTTPATGVPTTSSAAPQGTKRFYSGRGGAGNAHTPAERNAMSFDEIYKVQSHIDDKPMGHVGRGGAGNVFGKRAQSDASSYRSNSSSGSSIKSGFLRRLASLGQ